MHTYAIHKDRRCRKGFEIRWLHVRLLSPKIFINKFPGGFNTHRANLELYFIYIKNKSWIELFSILWMVFMEKLCVWLFHCSFYWLFPAGGLKGEVYQERLGLLCACASRYHLLVLPSLGLFLLISVVILFPVCLLDVIIVVAVDDAFLFLWSTRWSSPTDRHKLEKYRGHYKEICA